MCRVFSVPLEPNTPEVSTSVLCLSLQQLQYINRFLICSLYEIYLNAQTLKAEVQKNQRKFNLKSNAIKFKIIHIVWNKCLDCKDGLYQVLHTNTIPNTILDKNCSAIPIPNTNTIPNLNPQSYLGTAQPQLI